MIPQKTFQRDEDGNIVKDANNKPILQEGTPILAPQSGYSLTELEAKEDGSKPEIMLLPSLKLKKLLDIMTKQLGN